MENWTIEKLNQLIQDQIEESNVLDYKAADALAKTDGKKNEISKDVSAFANSNGGVIIYGIKEFDEKSKAHLPEKIDPVSRVDISKEWLEQVISTKIQPKIEGVEIIPVTVNEEDNTVVYVVEIPKSTTAHQAAGHKYHKRYNFQSEPMLDYEIRDVMNRSTHPVIELDFEIETKEVEVNNFMPTMGLGQSKTVEKTIYNTLKIIARNKGAVYANYVNYYVEINRNFLEKDEHQNLRTYKKDNSGRIYAEYYGENTIRDVVDVKGILPNGSGMYKYGPSRFDPILPGMHSRADKIKIIEGFNLFNEEYIEWKVYADNALPKTGRIKIADIPVTLIESK
jgi:hypothetical protein